MITSICPRCQETFRIPAGQLPDDAYATCPWCRETFPLSEVLANLPPALEITTADGEPLVIHEQAALGIASTGNASEQSGDGFAVVEDDLHTTVSNETVISETIAEDSWSQTSFEVDEDHVDLHVEDPSDSWDKPQVAEQPTPMTVAPRPRRKKSSGLRTMIGIVFGGLLSIPIALAILLLVGREPDLGFWPFDGPGTRRAPTAAPPGPLSERPKPSNTNPGRTLDTSAFDRAMAEIEDPASSALDELIPRSSDSDDDPVRQPSGQELALSSDSPTLIDVNEEAFPDLPDAEFPEAPSVDPNMNREVETVGLETTENATGATNENISDEPSLELPNLNSVTDVVPDGNGVASPTEEPPSAGNADAAQHGKGAMTLPNLDVVEPNPSSDAEVPASEAVDGLAMEIPEIATPSDAAPNEGETETAEMTLPEPEIIPESGVVNDESSGPSKETESPNPLAASAEAIARVTAAQDSIKQLLSLDPKDANRKPQLAQTYSTIAQACDVSGKDRAALPSLATTLLESPLLAEIEYAGTQWLVFAKRPTDGVALIGRPGTSPDGEIVTLDSGKIVDLLGDASVPTVEKVLIMGRIVDGEATVEVAHVEALP